MTSVTKCIYKRAAGPDKTFVEALTTIPLLTSFELVDTIFQRTQNPEFNRITGLTRVAFRFSDYWLNHTPKARWDLVVVQREAYYLLSRSWLSVHPLRPLPISRQSVRAGGARGEEHHEERVRAARAEVLEERVQAADGGRTGKLNFGTGTVRMVQIGGKWPQKDPAAGSLSWTGHLEMKCLKSHALFPGGWQVLFPMSTLQELPTLAADNPPSSPPALMMPLNYLLTLTPHPDHSNMPFQDPWPAQPVNALAQRTLRWLEATGKKRNTSVKVSGYACGTKEKENRVGGIDAHVKGLDSIETCTSGGSVKRHHVRVRLETHGL
ncbi:hypothetical protein JB92DRAFT_3091794 [Gautieria morchelliformis]|nr:hypothetical protein JB92DRAFT_3091794 [Gautieria morchelliformis]